MDNSSKKELLDSFDRFLESIGESSKKPYEELFRESMRKTTARQKADTSAHQNHCPHLQGSNALSVVSGKRTSIIWHRIGEIGQTFGICTNCSRQFHPADPDFKTWWDKPSGNMMSSSPERPKIPQFTQRPMDYKGDDQFVPTTECLSDIDARQDKLLQQVTNLVEKIKNLPSDF